MLTKTICILVLLGLTFDIVESNGFYSAASILAKDDSDPAFERILQECSTSSYKKFEHKTGKKKMVDCCVAVESCKCIDAECKKQGNDKNVPGCMKPCGTEPDCSQFTTEQCATLKSQGLSHTMIILIAVGVIVLLVLLGLTCAVCYKKFHRVHKDDKKNVKMSFGDNMNLNSKINVVSHDDRKGHSKRSKKASRGGSTNQVSSSKAPVSSAQPTGSFRSRTSKATTPSKATSSMTKPRESQKISRSTLQRAVM